MPDLKSQLIKMGSTHPALRPHIRKILSSVEHATPNRQMVSSSLNLLTLISKGRKGPINLNTLKSDLAHLGFRVDEAFVSYEPKIEPVQKYFEKVSPSKLVWVNPFSQEKKFLKKGESLFYMPHDKQIPFRGLWNLNETLKNVEAKIRTWKPMPLPGDV